MHTLNHCPICDTTSISSFIKTTAQMHSSKELFNFDQCADCQLVFLNPRVPLDQLKNYYTSHYLPYRGSKAWGKFERLVEGSQRKLDLKRLKRIKETQKLSSESLILDIGCGKPSFLEACLADLHCHSMGIDFSDEGWKDQPNHFKGLDLQVAEIKELSSNLKPDVITMWHYLEHDYSPLENLRYLKTIAKPTTSLIIEIPNFSSASRKKYAENWAGWHTPRHTSLFSPDNVKLLLKKSGWKVTHLLTYGTTDHYLLYWMSEMEQKGIQWDKNMEDEFWNFVLGKVLFTPKKWIEKQSSLGIMTVVASPDLDF
jgi:2-polyprenyl-3-methyl-5-hydroxy-6-metoxy-1,4-benzoquinol methylase